MGREGFPIAHEVLAGSTQDRKTLGRMLDLLNDRVGSREGSTVVVDRGVGPARRALRRKRRRALLCLPLYYYSSQPGRYSRVRNLFASGMLVILAAAESQSSLRPPSRSEMEARLTGSQIVRKLRRTGKSMLAQHHCARAWNSNLILKPVLLSPKPEMGRDISAADQPPCPWTDITASPLPGVPRTNRQQHSNSSRTLRRCTFRSE